MSEPTRAEINQQNSQHSTGPNTPEGKAISRLNALKHGLASGTLIIDGEDPAAYELLHHGFAMDLKPFGQMERALVEDMAKARWLKDRAIRFQGIAFQITMPHLENMAAPMDLSVLLRYQVANERMFFKCFKMLQELQKARALANQPTKSGFVSQKPQSAPISLPPDFKIDPKNPPSREQTEKMLAKLEALISECEVAAAKPAEFSSKAFGKKL